MTAQRFHPAPLWAILTILSCAWMLSSCEPVRADDTQWTYLGQFKATAYCSCAKCCGKSDGITASGKRAKTGTIACNWLPFGQKLYYRQIASNASERPSWVGSIGTVQDRGAKSLFGSKHNHIKHIDLWMPTHKEALIWGVRMVDVWSWNAQAKDLGI